MPDLSSCFTCLQTKSDFWKAKYDHEAAKKARAAAITAKKKTRRSKKKKKSTAEDLLKLDDDTSESEVALDSLGQFFNNLIDTDYCQDDTRASQAVEEEVTISSDSAHLPRQKLRVVTRKVRFSHPLAYLDPHFLLKKQQHESRRQARNNDDDEPPSVLQQTPRKRQNEVSFIFIFCFH